MKPNDFLDLLSPAAQERHRKVGIPASFTLAQAALESGWGSSKLFNRGRNIFGVKANKAWKGPVTVMLTKEHLKGKDVTVSAQWRVYETFGECLLDQAVFYKVNPRYVKCWKETTGEGWARAVAAAGYATDPDYAEKLISTIHARNLTRFDNTEKV